MTVQPPGTRPSANFLAACHMTKLGHATISNLMKAVDYGCNVVNVAKFYIISSKRFILFYNNVCNLIYFKETF